MQILYCKDKEKFGYHKISAIVPDIFTFGDGEKNADIFGIIIVDITQEQINDWANNNKWCVNDTQDGIKETPDEYKIPEE